MPYYRITITLKDKAVIQGIKYYDNYSIDAVTNIVRIKAGQHYGEFNIIDIEAAMLSNHCTAVKYYQESQQMAGYYDNFNKTTNGDSAKTKGILPDRL